MSETIKNYGRSIKTKLLNIAKEEQTFYQTILTRYFHERLLYRISQTHYKDNFFLKGGALMYVYERHYARPTLDIDFLGSNISNSQNSIIQAFREICAVSCEEDGVRFDVEHVTAENITEQKDYHGIRLSVPVKMDTIAQVLSMDIGFGDVVTPRPVLLTYPSLLDTLPMANIFAYSIETVIAEKMHAVVDLADQSSRMKDYYDLYHLLSNEEYDANILQEAIDHTFKARHTAYDKNTMFFRPDFADNEEMQRRWTAFIRKIKGDASVTFPSIVTFLQDTLCHYWEHLNKT
jgi:predicted nucleotidyltransferase component of viral defense system